MSRGSSVSIVSDYGLDYRAIEVRSPTEAEDFSSIPCVQTGSGPTQPPIQWIPGVLSLGVKRGRGLTLTTHSHLVPRLIMIGAILPLPPCASMACSRTHLPFFFLWVCWARSWINFVTELLISWLIVVSRTFIVSTFLLNPQEQCHCWMWSIARLYLFL
jgi:hypothetical protein